MKRKKLIFIFCALLLIAALFSACDYFAPKYEISFDPEEVSIETLKKFQSVRDALKKNYYQEVDENKLIEGAIAGMADSLNDPYTVYFTKEQMEAFTERTEGSYVGIGVTVIMDDSGILNIVESYEGSPARQVGLQQGDKILKVNDQDVTSIRDENIIVSMIKGEENTKVKISVYRPSVNKQLDFDIVRKKIKISNIRSEVLSDNIGYIKIIMFDEEMARYFNDNLNSLLKQKIKGLIIDLRDDPGGSYEEVVKIADRLLPAGTIVSVKDRNGKGEVEKSDHNELDLPIVVLVNGNSASASEILAGAIKDNNKGKLVGTKTFGKGLVQAVLPLNDGSGLKVTVARYYTPSGVCIQGIGILPDEVVEVHEKYKNYPVSQIPRGDDIQLQAGIEMMKEMIK